jgi:hypothetical protein
VLTQQPKGQLKNQHEHRDERIIYIHEIREKVIIIIIIMVKW